MAPVTVPIVVPDTSRQSSRRGNIPGQFDGAGSQSSHGSRPGSAHGSQGSNRGGSIVRKIEVPKMLDIGAEAYLLENKYETPQINMKRPGFATTGKDVVLKINSHRVLTFPNITVFQYDIVIGSGSEKRGLNSLAWHSKTVRAALGGGWVFDGSNIAWNMRALGSTTVTVDLDKEKGRAPNPRHENKVTIQVKQTKSLGLQSLWAYLNNKTDFGAECLEAINFLDHLMREVPSRPDGPFYSIKRSFFNRTLQGSAGLGAGVIAVKGLYQSIRIGMGGLVVNADVANQCFWADDSIMTTALNLALPASEGQIIERMQRQGPGQESKMFRHLNRLKKVRFTVQYPGMPEKVKGKVFVVDQILRTHAKNTFFKQTNQVTGDVNNISVYNYFAQQYGARIDHPSLPIVQACGKMMPKYPMEFCNIVRGQKYPFKLNDIQTSAMIRYAVTRPAQRAQAIAGAREAMAWGKDPALKAYDLKIAPDMLQTKAKILAPPKVEFAQGQAENPGTSGRWRIDGKKFIQPNSKPLDVYSVMIFNDWGQKRDMVTKDEVSRFIEEFIKLFRTHGGAINRRPCLIEEGNTMDMSGSVANHWNKVKNVTKGREAQLILFIVTAKNSAHYNRLKRQCDNRWGCVSQVMQSAHIKKCQGQYIGNVLLKVFAKLGGFGFRASPAAGKLGTPYPWFTVPTMMIGADVSHAAAGSNTASVASMTVSMDRSGMRYMAACQTNGRREEMITTWNMDGMLVPAFREWMSNVGGGRFPKHVIYFRDGVSEGQHQHVLGMEVKDMKEVWKSLDETPDKRFFKEMKFTVVVASKRHHIRFFPGPGVGDKNGNPQPGTLVERDVTHPREYDFYLCSHSAIQGTARPVHYHVLLDEAQMPVDKFVSLVYNHSYQYARSTTPVSIFPAIYYAHLAAKRALAHDRTFGEEPGEFVHTTSDQNDLAQLQQSRTTADRTGKVMLESARERLAALERKETPVLLPLGPAVGDGQTPPPDPRRFKWSMWYI